MENDKKSNVALILGIAIPLVVIILVAIFAYIPRTSIDPKYDFLYYFRDYTKQYCVSDGFYTVAKGKIKISDVVVPKGSECRYDLETDPPKIYRYDAEKGGHYQISFEDAQKLTLDNNVISPDGLSVRRGDYYNAGIFEIFGGTNRNYNQINLVNNSGDTTPIEIGTSNYYDFVFIGWVI